jgi:hypothetical protein
MNFKTTYILFGVLFGLLVVFSLVMFLTPPKPIDQAYVLPSLHDPREPVETKNIDSLTIERTSPKSENIAFDHDKDSGRWSMTRPFALKDYRVDRGAVDRVVDEVMNARREQNADVSSNLKDWGLDSPAVVITLHKGDKEWKLNLGNKVETKGGQTSVVYVTSSDRPKEVMAVRLGSLDAAFKGANEFRDKALLADSPSEIQSFTLQDGKHEPVILQQKTANRWKIAQPAFGDADYEGEAVGLAPGGKSVPGVRSLLDILSQVKVASDADFVSEEGRNLDQYGLGEGSKPELRIEVNRSLGTFGADKDKAVKQVLVLGKPVEEKGTKRYAMLEDEKYVVKIDTNFKPLQEVLENPGVLRDRDLVNVAEAGTDVVSVKNGGGTFEMMKPRDSFQWKLYRDSQAQNADDASVHGLLGALTAKRQIKEFADPKADDKSLGLEQPVAVISLWVDGIQKEEPKKDEDKDKDKKDTAKEGEKKEEKKDPNARPKLKSNTPTVKISFGKHDRDKGLVWVRRETNGEKPEDKSTVVAAVSDSLLDKVTQGPLAYLDRTLPIITGEATKLTLERNGQTFVIEKDKDKSSWQIKEPKELAGRPANQITVEEDVNELSRLRALKLITEKMSPEQEQQYGLKSARLKATVTTTGADKKPEDHVYLFGDDVKDDKGNVTGVYAKEAGHDLVFTVHKAVVDALQGELRDPVVFHFDPAKVQGLKLTGWQSVLGAPYTIDLEHKEGKWSVKSSTGAINLDPAKVDDFVTGLTRLRAEKFLDPKGEPKPEKMEVKDDALTVEVTVEGEKEPFTLAVGGETPDKKDYFASSNRLPGEFFLVPKEPFEKVRSKPAYFAK